jgi:transcriptional regulator with XRE-family HTH domain
VDLHLALKTERERQRVTAAEMGAHLGVSEDMVRRYDSGRSDISLRQAERYAERLGRLLGDVLPTTQVRASELQPLITALHEFDDDERGEVIAKMARDLTWQASFTYGRALRLRDADHSTPETTLPYTSVPTSGKADISPDVVYAVGGGNVKPASTHGSIDREKRAVAAIGSKKRKS